MRKLNSSGYLHLAYYAVEMTLHRIIIRSLAHEKNASPEDYFDDTEKYDIPTTAVDNVSNGPSLAQFSEDTLDLVWSDFSPATTTSALSMTRQVGIFMRLYLVWTGNCRRCLESKSPFLIQEC